jgi:protein-disulfide isomerase
MNQPLAIIALCGTLALAPALAVPDDDPSCKQQFDQVLAELRELRRLVEARGVSTPSAPAKPESVSIDIGEAPFLGTKNAPITIVEFTDYQ